MRLYLVRHGEAVSEYEDPERPLTSRGREAVEKVAGFLKKSGVSIEAIFHSGKLRALQSAEVFRAKLSPECDFIEKDYLNPGDSTEELFKVLTRRREDLMVVGHLPFLSKMLSQLVLNNEDRTILNFTTASVVILDRDPEHGWHIVGFISPEVL